MMGLDFYSLKKTVGKALFMLFVFVLVLDPTGSILHLKNITFVLLVAYNMVCFRPDFSKLPIIVAVFSVILLSWVFATIQDVHLDTEATMGIFKAIAPLLLLLWIREYDLLSLARLPMVLTATLVVVLYWLAVSAEEIEAALYLYVTSNGEDTIMMAHRSFLGVEVFAMYYKSIVSFILVFAFCIAAFFDRCRRNIGIILCTVLFVQAYIISGSRTMILLPFFLFGVIGYRKFKDKRYFKYILYPFLFVFAIAFVVLLFMLIMEKGESSNMVKYAHLGSYWDLFSSHPQYLLFGQGPGSAFYSEGFRKMTTVTEWTYLELLRYFGIFSLVIIYVFYRPLFQFWKHFNDDVAYAVFWGYLAYLLIAGTNPLLLSSTGMLVLLIAYSYVEKLEQGAKGGDIS